MSKIKHALLLVGSVRARSSSAGLAKGLGDLLMSQGLTAETMLLIPDTLNRNWDGLLAAWERADLIVLSFPLYVDSLPSYVIRGLEMLAGWHQGRDTNTTKEFAAICNSGFPEASQNQTALSICELFAGQMGLRWLGGLPLGGGGALGGNTPQESGGMMRNVVDALKLAASALASGECIPDQAVELISKPFIPASLYRIVGGRSFKQQAEKNGVVHQVKARPYQ